MCKKLECYGIRGTNTCKISGIKSPKSKVDKGVPKESILGSLLFTLYIKDMTHCSNLKVVHYVDDNTGYDFWTDISIPTNKINFKLKKLDEWLRAYKLSLKFAKSFFSFFQTRKMVWCLSVVLED